MDSIEAMAMDAMSAAAADEMLGLFRADLHRFLEESPVVNGTRDGALMAFANVAAHRHVGLPLGRYGDPATEAALAAVVPVFLALAHLVVRNEESARKALAGAEILGEKLAGLKDGADRAITRKPSNSDNVK